jgi:hypothetical protein
MQPDIMEALIKRSGELLREAEAEDLFEEKDKPSRLEITDAQFDDYTDAVIEAAKQLLKQNPKVIILPGRGGIVHGNDVLYAASQLASKFGKDTRGYPIRLDARGISHDVRVRERFKNYLLKTKESVESVYCTDKEWEGFIIPPLDDITIIDTAYTGMAYSKIFDIVRGVFTNAKINGIVLKDKQYKSDLSILGYAHKATGGDFYAIDTFLPFEDKNVLYHRLRLRTSVPNVENILELQTPDFIRSRIKIEEMIESKVGRLERIDSPLITF